MADSELIRAHHRLVEALLSPSCYPHPVDAVQRLETHISTLLLAGDYAYKLKKPLNLGFLDFTSAARREACCQEELRLNGRFAPELYLGVSEITGTPDAPHVDGAGEVLDHAVRMRRFPQEHRLDRVLERGDLRPDQVDILADDIAAFHLSMQASGPPPSPMDSVDGQLQPILENLTQLDTLLHERGVRTRMATIALWTRAAADALRPLMRQRVEQGFIRECHGDLHLENIVLLTDRPVPFDGIEFSAGLRWIDVINELAFLCMDLVHRRRGDYSARLLSRYLDATDDHNGVALLRFYQVYRALVRAKIQALHLAEGSLPTAQRTQIAHARDDYLALAEHLTIPPPPSLTITCGLAGSGKSTAALALVERTGAIRLRSDVQRKRLRGLKPLARSGSAIGGGIYTEASSHATYQKLAELADSLLTAGWPVVVDAAFLKRWQRRLFRDIAARQQCAFQLLYCEAPVAELRQRIRRRADEGEDPSEADTTVLNHQITEFEPPDREESAFLLRPATGGQP
ncbi:MAG: AAA family ATPase [Aquisalimonadaceae bacterium]